jgi:hypothetical protein
MAQVMRNFNGIQNAGAKQAIVKNFAAYMVRRGQNSLALRSASHELEGEARGKIIHISGVVSWLSRLREEHPDGQCKFPAPPFREDEW